MSNANEVVYVPEDDYLKSLQKFSQHVKASVAEMLNTIDAGGEYDHKHDIKIEVNGVATRIEMHADAFDRLTSMIDTEMLEYVSIFSNKRKAVAKRNEMIDALRRFREAYSDIQNLWDDVDLNDTKAIGLYPFEQSFNEVSIPDWANETIEELKK